MRRMRLLMLALGLFAPLCYAQQHYTEAGCILLFDQMQRFSAYPQRASYREAKRQYDKYCYNQVLKPGAQVETAASDPRRINAATRPLESPDTALVAVNPAKAGVNTAAVPAAVTAAPSLPSAPAQPAQCAAVAQLSRPTERVIQTLPLALQPLFLLERLLLYNTAQRYC
jgi:hypothetical protein